jgi:hypothetical protein
MLRRCNSPSPRFKFPPPVCAPAYTLTISYVAKLISIIGCDVTDESKTGIIRKIGTLYYAGAGANITLSI